MKKQPYLLNTNGCSERFDKIFFNISSSMNSQINSFIRLELN